MLALVGEVGEAAELFQWKEKVAVGLAGWSEKDRVHLGTLLQLNLDLIHLIF